MVFLEIIFVLAGWNYGIFDSSFVYCVDIWDFILCISVCICDFYLCEGASLWGSGRGLAFYGMHYFVYRRCTAFVRRNYGTIYEQNVYGSKGQAQIPC